MNRNKDGKFAKIYRFKTRNEYEIELQRLEKDIKTQASVIREDTKKIDNLTSECDAAWESYEFAKEQLKYVLKFPIARFFFRCAYGRD